MSLSQKKGEPCQQKKTLPTVYQGVGFIPH